MHIAKIIIVTGLAIAAAGCATSDSWTRSDIRSAQALERQRTIDVGRCRQVSSGSAPMPAVPAARAPTGYDISGTYGRTGQTHGTFQGTVRPQSGGFGGGFADGMARGMAMRQVADARRDREQIFAGCMTALGWSRGG